MQGMYIYLIQDEAIYGLGFVSRWKGENVSTNEVDSVVGAILELKDATTYGVEIPGADGRAGMLAIPAQCQADINFSKLEKGLEEKLPAYARPLFIRLVKEADLTSKKEMTKIKLNEQKLIFPFSSFRYLQVEEE